MKTVTNTHHVAGTSFRVDAIMELARDNYEYDYSKREMVKEDLIDERVYKYYFPNYDVSLIPEPDNQYDPNAIKVVVGGQHVGYIKKGSTAHFHKQLRAGKIVSISADIGGGPWKKVTEEEDEDGKTVYEMDKDKTPLWVALNVTELVPGEEPANQTPAFHFAQPVPEQTAPFYAASLQTVQSKPARSPKDKTTALLLCIFLGMWGGHRFYAGKTGTAILYLFTVGLCGFGWLVDIIMIACGKFKDSTGRPISESRLLDSFGDDGSFMTPTWKVLRLIGTVWFLIAGVGCVAGIAPGYVIAGIMMLLEAILVMPFQTVRKLLAKCGLSGKRKIIAFFVVFVLMGVFLPKETTAKSVKDNKQPTQISAMAAATTL